MILLIDKPKGMTSHDVVDAVRRATKERRVGHGGTLDPQATGLLIVGVGRESTKKLSVFTKEKDKTYEAEIFLGANSDTDDSEGKIEKISDVKPTLDEIKTVLESFVGVQMQTPPPYSAIKIRGKKAYEIARSGEKVDLKQREITIHSIKLVNYDYPILKTEVKVSSGTYIRSLARDLGVRLTTGAYLKELRRTKIGEYDVKNAKSLEEIKQLQPQQP